jgi:photosystem II stability/assembly factor-like uncharacterized protein
MRSLMTHRSVILASALTAAVLFFIPGLGSTVTSPAEPESHAMTSRWVRTGGPVSGGVTDLLIDPVNASIAYRATADLGVARSADGGRTWRPANQGLPDIDVEALAIDSVDHLVLYAGLPREGVFKSTDAAASWAPANNGLPDGAFIYSLAVDPTDPLILYAGAHGPEAGVFKSTDGGASWSVADTGLPEIGIKALAIDPTNPSSIYAGTDDSVSGGDGVYKSTDEGDTWVPSSSGELATLNVYSLVIDGAHPGTLYAGTAHVSGPGGPGVFKTTDRGATWKKVSSGSDVWALALDTAHPQVIYAGTKSGVSKSIDGGEHWRGASEGIGSELVTAVEVSPSRSQVALAGARGVLYRTTNGGALWIGMTNVMANALVSVLAADPADGGTLYAGTEGQGVFKTTDAGRTWGQINEGLTNIEGTSVLGLAVDPTDPERLYAGLPGRGVFKSMDAGSTWIVSNSGITDLDIESLAIDPTDHDVVYAGAGRKVYKSTDGGDTWAEHASGLEFAGLIRALVIDPTNPLIVYAGGFEPGGADSDGVFKSTDGGVTWVRASEGIGQPRDTSVTALVIEPGAPGKLYAAVTCADDDECNDTRVYKTTDGASSWVPTVAVDDLLPFTSIALDPSDPDTVYAGHDDLGVYRTSDGGVTWEVINNGLTNTSIEALVFSASGELYAGTLGSGVFRFLE